MVLSQLLQFVLGLDLVLQVLQVLQFGQTLLGPGELRMAGQIQKAVGLAPQRDSVLSTVVQMEQVGFEPGQMVMELARVDQTLLDLGGLQMADQILLGLPAGAAAAAAVVGPLVQRVS